LSTMLGSVLIIITIGVAFIIISWFISKSLTKADEYMMGKGKLGIAFGVTSLLAFWITGNTIMAAPEAGFTDGVIGALAYSTMGGMGVVLFGPLGHRIHQILPNARTVGDFYKNRFDNKNYYFFLIMCIIYIFGLLMTQGIGGGLLLEQVFDVPYGLSVFLTIAICTIYASIGGFASVTGIAFFQVMLILLVVIIVPPMVYLTTGVAPIYEGMMKFTPDMLNLLRPSGLMLMFAGTVVATGEVFMDNTFWQRAYAIKKEKISIIYTLAGLGWFFVPLATAILAFVALGTQQEPAQVNQVAVFISQVYGGNFVSWVFLVGVWAALASTIAAVLNSIVTLIVNDLYLERGKVRSEKDIMKMIRILTIVVGIGALLLSLLKLLTMLQMLIFLGVINAAFIFPIIYGLFWKKLNINASFLAAILAIVAGYIVYFKVGALQGVVVSGWISFLVCTIGSLVKPESFDWNVLEKVGLKEE
jgi:Na+/proline symporter